MKDHPQLEAVSTLVGTVIGAGVLGLPYIIAKAGLLNGIILLLLLGATVTLMYLYYGEIILRTKKIHQLSGYAEKYLGKWGKLVATISFLISIYGAMIAYLLGSGSALSSIFGGSSLVFTIIFLAAGAILVHKGIAAVEKSESYLMFIVLGLILFISALCIGKIQPANLTGFKAETLFLPYGLILFALHGTNAIPEMREELIKDRRLLKKSIIIGMLIPIAAYILFSVVVVGVVGANGFATLGDDEKIATVALIPYLGSHLAVIGNLFAVFAVTTSFLSVSLSLKDMFMYDFNLDERLAFVLTFLPPLIPVLLRLTSFIMILELMGIIVGGITAFLIVLMFWKSKRLGDREPEYTMNSNPLMGLIILFIVLLGTIYALFF
jgi:tyrosine-specific transport protein